MIVVGLVLCGCEDDSSSQNSSSSGTSSSAADTRQIAWEQQATSQQIVDSYIFAAIVDGAPAGRLAASCTATSSAGTYTCSAPLPPLSAGTHTLAITTMDGNAATSALSNSVSITIAATTRSTTAAVTTPAESALLSLTQVCMGDGPARTCYQLNRTATNLKAPEQPTEMPDGRIVVLDQGVPLEIEQGVASPVAADIPREARIADFSLAPDSKSTAQVYALEVTEANGSRMADVVRFRDVGGVLGQRAVIVPGIPLPKSGDPVLLVDDTDVTVAVPQQGDGANTGAGLILRYDRTGRPTGGSIGSPTLAWGPGRPSVLMEIGGKLAAAGVAPGAFVLGTIPVGATSPVPMPVTSSLTASGGVRAVARLGQLVLIAAGDGSAYVGGASTSGEPTSLQKVDTRGAVITGIATTSRGTIVATAQVPINGTPAGRVYELTPVRDPSAR
jgi:hypothetical protein